MGKKLSLPIIRPFGREAAAGFYVGVYLSSEAARRRISTGLYNLYLE